MAKALRQGFGNTAVVTLPPTLRRSELKGIKLSGGDRNSIGSEGSSSSVGMILLCHYNEGRVLLTDEDGMYNDFIMEACRVAGGNVFVALAPVSTAPTALANETLVTALAYTGGQQGLLSIHMQKRFLTWDKTPSDVQLDFLRGALEGDMEPLEVPESVLQHSGGRSFSGLSFCNIL